MRTICENDPFTVATDEAQPRISLSGALLIIGHHSTVVSVTYDTLKRLQTLTPPTAFSGSGNFGFTSDTLSRRTQMTRPNGLKSVYAV